MYANHCAFKAKLFLRLPFSYIYFLEQLQTSFCSFARLLYYLFFNIVITLRFQYIWIMSPLTYVLVRVLANALLKYFSIVTFLRFVFHFNFFGLIKGSFSAFQLECWNKGKAIAIRNQLQIIRR